MLQLDTEGILGNNSFWKSNLHCISQYNAYNLCWCLQRHRTCLAHNCIQLLLTFFAIMRNNFSYYTVCMGLFYLWNLHQTNQIRNPCIVTVTTLGKVNLKNVLLKIGLTSSYSATQTDTKVSTAGETEDLVSFTKEENKNVLQDCHGCLSFAMQCYLPGQILSKVCMWNHFTLASLMGCLLTYN